MRRAFFIVGAIAITLIFSTSGTWAQKGATRPRLEELEAAVASLQAQINTLNSTVSTLQMQVNGYREVFRYLTVDMNEINGLTGPHVIFTGVNVHIRSGSGATTDDSQNLWGLGNLIIGYNESDGSQWRLGSHNLVMGYYNSFRSYGGLVGGKYNYLWGPLASVTGGSGNMASGECSSVTGGLGNTASGASSHVSGGYYNGAAGIRSTITGGAWNATNGTNSSVSGGQARTAWDDYNWVAGSLFEIY